MDWSASAALAAPVAIGGGSAGLLELFVPIAGGETVIRIRGLATVASDQTAAAEDQIGAFGVGVVSEQAATVGITAVPFPVADAAWGGWMWHSYFARNIVSLSSVGIDAGLTHQIIIDTKAMRKVGENERLIMVVENVGAGGIDVTTQMRLLSKVH